MPNPQSTPLTAMLWTGRIISALTALLLLFSGVMKLVKPEPVVEGFIKLGYSPDLATGIGIVEITCTVLYVIPQTTVLGAILLTGYLGGATATHLRVGDPYFGPIVIGVMVWLGIFLRDPRLRILIPFRKRL